MYQQNIISNMKSSIKYEPGHSRLQRIASMALERWTMRNETILHPPLNLPMDLKSSNSHLRKHHLSVADCYGDGSLMDCEIPNEGRRRKLPQYSFHKKNHHASKLFAPSFSLQCFEVWPRNSKEGIALPASSTILTYWQRKPCWLQQVRRRQVSLVATTLFSHRTSHPNTF